MDTGDMRGTANSVAGDVHGISIMGRDFSGDINLVGEPPRLGDVPVSDLSVALPDSLVRHRLRGRDDLLAELVALVGTGGTQVVLCGAGGCGKSALAYTLADGVRAGRTVWWVDGTSRETLVSGLFEVAVQAGASRVEAREVWRNGESAKDLLWRVLHRFATPWLLVVDNADVPSSLDGWLRQPPAGNTVLVTSRDHRPSAWPRHAVLRQVLPISGEDGAAVLTELAPRAGDEDEARHLANRLGGLPLALVLVGAYLARTSTGPVLPEARHPRSFADYTAALDTEFPEMISSLSDQVLVRTWERSLDLLALQGVPAARPLLRLLAFFASPVVPAVLLIPSVMARVPELFPETADLEQAVDGLVTFGLIGHQRVAHADSFVLHPLIGEVTRIQPDALANAALYQALRRGLLWQAATDHTPDHHSNWPVWQLLFPLCAFTGAETERLSGNDRVIHADLAYHAGRYARQLGLWSVAEERFTTALRLWAERVPASHEKVLAVRHSLAFLKVDQGRYSEAESDFRDAIGTAAEAGGADHPAMLPLRHGLARVLREQGRYDVAEHEFARLVPRLTQEFGPEHERTLSARYERARTRRDLGDLVFARSELEELVAIETEVYGATAPDTLTTRYELAEMLQRQGMLAEAQEILSDVVALETRVQGADHPSTLVTRLSLVEIAFKQGRHEEVETELHDIVAAWVRAGAEDHPHALNARTGLAAMLANKGDLAAAEAEYRVIAAALAKSRGPDHPDTLAVQRIIAHLRYRSGRDR